MQRRKEIDPIWGNLTGTQKAELLEEKERRDMPGSKGKWEEKEKHD